MADGQIQFWPFLTTYHLYVDIFYHKRGQKYIFFDQIPTYSCPRSHWTSPKDFIQELKSAILTIFKIAIFETFVLPYLFKVRVFYWRSQNLTKSSPSIWHLLYTVKSSVKISSIFVAFLENTNFTSLDPKFSFPTYYLAEECNAVEKVIRWTIQE